MNETDIDDLSSEKIRKIESDLISADLSHSTIALSHAGARLGTTTTACLFGTGVTVVLIAIGTALARRHSEQ